MRLSIRAVEVRVARRRYRRAFQISSGTTPELLSVLVMLHAQGTDHVGLGETTPMTAYSGQTPAGIVEALEAYLAPAVTGHDLFDLAGLHRCMDQAIRGQWLAKAALDMAVLDLQGKVLGLPVACLLGGRVRPQVPLAWVIGLGDIDDIVAEAAVQAGQGYRHIKVKVGMGPRRDVELVRALRQALPDDVDVAVDANEGYDFETALWVLRRMEVAGVSLVEQPLPSWDLEGMARLCRAVDIPIMADESLQTLHDALELARRGAADVFNIKILKVGGLYRARQVAAVAEAAGIPVKVGSMPELGLATLAGAHFAAATPGATVPADLIGPLMVEGDILQQPQLTPEACPGVLPLPEGPGLGARLASQVEQQPAM